MHAKQTRGRFIVGAILLLLTIVLAACGSSNASSATTSTPTATTACPSTVTGTIQSINTNTVQITTLQGKNIQALLSSKTIFIRQATLQPSALTTGTLVSVTVKQNSDNTYSALSVNVRTSLTNLGGGGFFRGSNPSCRGQRIRGNGTPGAFGGGGFGPGNPGGGQNRQTISGTVNQMNGNTLTVADTSGNDFTFTLIPTTRISAQQTVTASDLRIGGAVSITGLANSQGVFNATSVAILQNLPTNHPVATPSPNA